MPEFFNFENSKAIQWLFLVTLFVMLVMTSGCENQMSTQRGVVSGLVLDQSGNRVVGALVTSHRSLFRAETDKNGHYRFTSLDVGTHRLSVEKDGFFIASRSVEIDYGQVLEGIDIIVEDIPDLIVFSLVVRESRRVVLDIDCAEPMSVFAAWNEVGGTRLQTPPTELAYNHQIELDNLYPGAEYRVRIEGFTADSRRFASEYKIFKTVNPLDIDGAPDTPEDFKVVQSTEGPRLTWSYSGIDPVEGFRLYRKLDEGELSLLFDETQIFSAQTSCIDDDTEAGRVYSYALEAVDYEGNVSSMTLPVSIIPAGDIQRDLTWKKSFSPIHISGDIKIPAGRTLTIEPGTEMVFKDTDEGATGFRPEECEFIVEGTLLAEGSEDEPIKMISGAAFPGRKDWDGIRVLTGVSQNKTLIKHVLIAGAENGLELRSSNAEISELKFRFCDTALGVFQVKKQNIESIFAEECNYPIVFESSSDCALKNIQISDCVTGMRLLSNKNLSIQYFDIRNASEVAVQTTVREGLKLSNGLLHSAKTGLDAGGSEADYQYLTIDAVNGIIVNGAEEPILKNCIVVNQSKPATGYGIEDKTLGRSYPYNNIFGFSQATFNCDQLGGPILNVNPQFVGQNNDQFDYHLLDSSPLKTASENNGEIGAYGSGL
jgi:hypothetical protein